MMKKLFYVALAIAALGEITTWSARAQDLPDGRGGSFDVTCHKIPLSEIRGGGPAKDGIPSLTNPEFVSAKEGDKFMVSWDRVLGVVRDGQAKAYPIKILNWHEVVNDTIAGKPIAVSW